MHGSFVRWEQGVNRVVQVRWVPTLGARKGAGRLNRRMSGQQGGAGASLTGEYCFGADARGWKAIVCRYWASTHNSSLQAGLDGETSCMAHHGPVGNADPSSERLDPFKMQCFPAPFTLSSRLILGLLTMQVKK